MAINKVIYGGTTLIDLSGDSLASANQLMQGVTAHDRTGALITGTGTGGVDGDNLAYGVSLVGSAIVGTSVVS
jgi:hypothetical protein